jgi:hypothetical protein
VESPPRPPQIASWSGNRRAGATLCPSVVGTAEAIATLRKVTLLPSAAR